jgi:hypothetical protein
VAVSRNAVENAVSAGAADLAPAEINGGPQQDDARQPGAGGQGLRLARDLASQAQADAKLAQSKANSAKANAAANALDEDLRVLREEVDRANKAPAVSAEHVAS